MATGTSIGLGDGEVIVVDQPLRTMRDLLQDALVNRRLLELTAKNGETVILNPIQIKVLQSSM